MKNGYLFYTVRNEKLQQVGAEIGISTYDNVRIEDIQRQLPSVEELKNRLRLIPNHS